MKKKKSEFLSFWDQMTYLIPFILVVGISLISVAYVVATHAQNIFIAFPNQQFLEDKSNQQTINLETSTSDLNQILPPKPPTDGLVPPPEVQQWLLAAGAILSERNIEGFDKLEVPTPKGELSVLVKDSWDVVDHDTAVKTLLWLERQGHSEQYASMRKYLLSLAGDDQQKLEQLRPYIRDKLLIDNTREADYVINFTFKHKDDLAEDELIAWDNMKIINLARWSYTLGYLSASESWWYAHRAGLRIQQQFTSWEDASENYFLGRSFWLHTDVHPDFSYTLFWLTSSEKSPWKTTPFDRNLEQAWVEPTKTN